ncbi:MAG: ATP-binding protein [Bacteroidota bacterium]
MPGVHRSTGPLAKAFAEGQAEAARGLEPYTSDGIRCACGESDRDGPLGRRFCACPDGQRRRAAFELAAAAGDRACQTPARLAGATLGECRASVQNAEAAELRRQRHDATAAVERFEAAFREGRRPGAGLCLFGPVGTGKSYMLAALAAAVRARGVPVVWTTYASLVAAIRRHYGTPLADTVEVNLQRCAVLVIDDLGDPFRSRGPVQETEDRRRLVLSVIAERAAHFRPTLISANYGSLDEMADQFDPRIADRVRESCEVHTLSGPSLRKAPRI